MYKSILLSSILSTPVRLARRQRETFPDVGECTATPANEGTNFRVFIRLKDKSRYGGLLEAYETITADNMICTVRSNPDTMRMYLTTEFYKGREKHYAGGGTYSYE